MSVAPPSRRTAWRPRRSSDRTRRVASKNGKRQHSQQPGLCNRWGPANHLPVVHERRYIPRDPTGRQSTSTRQDLPSVRDGSVLAHALSWPYQFAYWSTTSTALAREVFRVIIDVASCSPLVPIGARQCTERCRESPPFNHQAEDPAIAAIRSSHAWSTRTALAPS